MDKQEKQLNFSNFIIKSKEVILKVLSMPQVHYILVGILLLYIGRSIVNGPKAPNINFMAEVLIYTIAALGLNLLLGFSGLVSLSTAAFIGVTTNGMNLLINTFEYSFILSAIIMIIISALFGLLIGFLSLQMEGIYLAIATLFVGYILTQFFTATEIFNNGRSVRIGAVNLYGDVVLNNILPADRIVLYNIVVVMLVLMFIITHHIIKSPTGRALMAISRSQHAAQAMGIKVKKYRIMAFVIATIFASVAGISHVIFSQTTGTADKWGLNLSLLILAVVVIGGMKSVLGMLLGAFIIFGVPSLYLQDLEWFKGVESIMTGLLLVLVIIFYPYGLAHIYYDIKKIYYKIKTRIKARLVKNNE
ncbi:branched-chain amino acid ABC transporter permease [Hujiaoplasma nucleasis]|uniref:Branched-chain amino acid ABC transporter permease n=1 Tax=Hujiaoplasma nucleasis TaxID=2725268 RepID=A0A7L6N6G6_9MOLU|nr:branched-chain amino acid ABC transporter permease [Hujiaoplasma nucleasis]QLY40094.1 branched-chain amino acid ABC transporter permease [Hujiaoplasma nucleasis]